MVWQSLTERERANQVNPERWECMRERERDARFVQTKKKKVPDFARNTTRGKFGAVNATTSEGQKTTPYY